MTKLGDVWCRDAPVRRTCCINSVGGKAVRSPNLIACNSAIAVRAIHDGVRRLRRRWEASPDLYPNGLDVTTQDPWRCRPAWVVKRVHRPLQRWPNAARVLQSLHERVNLGVRRQEASRPVEILPLQLTVPRVDLLQLGALHLVELQPEQLRVAQRGRAAGAAASAPSRPQRSTQPQPPPRSAASGLCSTCSAMATHADYAVQGGCDHDAVFVCTRHVLLTHQLRRHALLRRVIEARQKPTQVLRSHYTL